MTCADLSVAEAGRRLRAGTLTSVALTEAALARVHALDPELHAFITITEGRALSDARRADEELRSGRDRGPLHGIPYGLKDIYDTADIRTTCCSRLSLNRVPSTDSNAAARLAAGGGVLIGKLTTHEFATMGPSFDLPFPPARNPLAPEHVPGGSSSGAAVAVASAMLRIAAGSDTGGSIRIPAAYCGVVGLKPTYGRVSKRGVYPLSYALDHCGPLARNVEDAAIMLQVIAGYDPADPGSADWPVPDYRLRLEAGVAGLRIGVPRDRHAGATANGQETIDRIETVVERLRNAGAIVEDVVLPDDALFMACGRVIIAAESFSVHAENLRRRPLDFGAIALERFVVGAGITAADLLQAYKVRRELTEAVNVAFKKFDAVITAGILGTAPRFDEQSGPVTDGVPIKTMRYNVTGHPAMSVPIGPAKNGLPLAIEIAGRHFDEATVLRVGRSVESMIA